MYRCEWCGSDELYTLYHDKEWGKPVHDDGKLFEFLVLESAQAGLSWITILRRRENYRRAYEGFDPASVAAFDEEKAEELLADAGIIRNRRKIASSINNARRFLEVQREFGSFDRYLWGFCGGKPIVNDIPSLQNAPVKSELSDRLSADLKKRGFQFLGSVIVYSYLQAVGVLDDHVNACFCKSKG